LGNFGQGLNDYLLFYRRCSAQQFYFLLIYLSSRHAIKPSKRDYDRW